jgi:Bacterial extracellular solute-binding protein
MTKRKLWTAALASLATASAGAPRPSVTVTVTASELAAPCVRAAARAWSGAASVCVGPECATRADVLVLSAVEMTRALESGRAIDGSDLDVARVPWVLALRGAGPEAGIKSLSELGQDQEVRVLGGPAAYEARRALERVAARVRETTDGRELSSAAVALVPLSLARGARQVAVDVPPVVVRAAVATSSRRQEAASAFVRFLGSDAGQRAFSACRP